MATLLISAAVNIGVSLLLNFLFPPKGQDITQEGPRLSDLTVTSSSYGQAINVGFGTVRMGGNVIWSPGVEEVANTETQESGGKGGGGGGSVTQTTYSYFASFAIAFSEGVADDVLRIWGDGKLIYDKTGTGLATDRGLRFRFYRGTETQLPDALIEADKGAGNVPGHRGLCYLVAERWPLADFGNRIPQITAEITYAALGTMPFSGLVELSGMDIPGSASGADANSHMFIDPFTDSLYMLKAGSTTRNSIGAFATQALSTNGGINSRSSQYGANGFLYSQDGGSNYSRFVEVEPNGMQATGRTFGFNGSLGSWGSPFNFPNGSEIGVFQVGAPEMGLELEEVFVFTSELTALGGDGFVVVYKEGGIFKQDNHFDANIGRGGRVIQDHHNRRLFVTLENDTTVNLWEVFAEIGVGLLGAPTVLAPEKRLVGSYSKGGAQYAGTADTDGWVVLPTEEALILSNGVSMFKVDTESGAVLATNLSAGFFSKNGWSINGKFAYGNGHSGGTDGGVVTTIDTDDLSIRSVQDLGLAGFGDGIESNYKRSAYDPRSHSLILSRVNGSSPATNRVVRVLLERGTGLGTSLDSVVSDLCGRAGLSAADFDVAALSGQSVRGFVVNRRGAVRSALEPLQRGFLFEGVESDWKIKFVLRGAGPVLTVPESDLGRLSLESADEFVKEVRVQEVELPGVFNVVYSDREKDYQQGHQQDRRVAAPSPTQFARNSVELNLPIVYVPSEAKQLAQRWLYTSWAERLTISSVLPWRYLRLDPTDVFEQVFRGETRRLRLSTLEVGAGLDLDFMATQEDSRSNDSDAAGDGGLGFVPQLIPSGLPTRLHLMDLPLLTAADASLQQFSRAYWAASGHDDSWPGAQMFNSRDAGNSFQEIGSAPLESAWGFVVGTLPDPASTTTWDESATVDVRVARGLSRFQTRTDSEVLNGANALAVFRADGTAEIIQFVTVTSVDASTVRLGRLLRGRRGTEPLSTGHAVSARVVLLEFGRTYTFQLPLELLNVTTQYKGVTLNTLVEDGITENFAYTGQDLVPYSPVDIRGSLNASNNVDVTWKRRTRFGGELRDNTGVVPLNETSERYEVDVKTAPGGAVTETLAVTSESAEIVIGGGLSTFLVPADVNQNDVSVNKAVGTLGAQASVSAVQSKFGGKSLEFTPSGSVDPSAAFVSYPDAAAYTIGTQQFTIECWVRFKALPASTQQVMMSQFENTSTGEAWALLKDPSGLLGFVFNDGPTFTTRVSVSGSWAPVIDTWYHVAATRDATNTIRVFVNGTQVASLVDGANINNSTTALRIGKLRATGFSDNPLNGFVDDARITIGEARYTSNFSVPTNGFLDDEIGVLRVLGLSFDGSDGDTTTVDSSYANRTPTFNGSAQIDTAQSKFGGGSLLIGGVSGSNVEFPDSGDFTFEANRAFTIQAWVRLTAVGGGGNHMVVSHGAVGSAQSFFLRIGNAGQVTFDFSLNGTTRITINSATGVWVADNTWGHLAVTRDTSGNIKLFVNGVQVGSAVNAGALFNPSTAIRIGGQVGVSGEVVNGWIDELEIVKDRAIWTSNFTPPTQGLLSISGTPSSVTVEVFQLSDPVGRGRGQEATIEL